MRLLALTLYLIVTLVDPGQAQLPDTSWTRVYPLAGDEWANAVQPTPDGGYLLAGGKLASGNPSDIYVLKTDNAGNVLWERSYGGPEHDEGVSIALASDAGYVIGASANNLPMIIRLTAEGDTLWTQTFQDGSGDWVRVFADSTELQFAVFYFVPPGDGYSCFRFVLLDDFGQIMLSQYDGPRIFFQSNTPTAITETRNGGWAVAGDGEFFRPDGGSFFSMWIVWMDSAGNQIGMDMRSEYIEVMDITNSWEGGQLALVDGAEYRLLAYDSSMGFPVWHVPIPPYSSQIDRGSLTGYTIYSTGWLYRFDNVGNLYYQRNYSVPLAYFSDFEVCADGGYIIGGSKRAGAGEPRDVFLLKTEPDTATLNTTEPSLLLPWRALLGIFPNPFNAVTTFMFTLPRTTPVTLSVFNTLGQRVREVNLGQMAAGEHRYVFEAGGLPSGVYLARVEAAGKMETRKMVLMR